jgi:aryl carrier-like protein
MICIESYFDKIKTKIIDVSFQNLVEMSTLLDFNNLLEIR